MTPPSRLLPALLGGTFIGVLSVLPFVKAGNACCCLWVLLGGMLAAYVQQQNHPRPIGIGDGALVGLLAGLAGGMLAGLLAIPVDLFFNAWAPGVGRAGLLRSDGDLPPDVRERLHALMGDRGQTVLSLLMQMIVITIDMVVGTIGGLLGAVFFRKTLTPPPAPPSASLPPALPGGWPEPESSPRFGEGPDAPPPGPLDPSSTR